MESARAREDIVGNTSTDYLGSHGRRDGTMRPDGLNWRVGSTPARV